MKLVSTKIDKAARQAKYAASEGIEQDEYPYGCCVRLEEELIKRLGIKNLPEAGAELTLTASVKVTGVNSRDTTTGGVSRSLELQITQLALEAPTEKAEKVLYGES